ncbi:hypothetical protein, conserved [Babesia bigemina]|uniref:Uncharacterized protein n=1 Tax=Babesia bigemina TaxID=5866 RepID=A0A061DC97_BABBI|nr:hypothetical protein, conserved [Babesia bigemina]CDR96589.1 hypothetical protein, conserved [Babesia bigemina]|eukprot:XP_012768775.1 hypothetical protein, conserved [Babesia bigemina]
MARGVRGICIIALWTLAFHLGAIWPPVASLPERHYVNIGAEHPSAAITVDGLGEPGDYHGAERPRPPGKMMLQNQTKMRNNLERENLTGMKVIEGFCIDGMHCWPMKVFAVTMLVLHLICCFAALYVSANLYSSGLSSSTFYRNGGAMMIIMAAAGACLGVALSLFLGFCMMNTLAFAGPMMSLFVAAVLMGKRGVLLGSFGGMCAGLPIGSMMQSHEVGISLGAIIGILVGGIVGICPFFRNLDMNQRYINKETEYQSFRMPELGSFSSDGYHGHHNVMHIHAAEYR